jgi:hypothetical protein
MRKYLPDHKAFIGLTTDGDFTLVEYVASGCNALVFRGFSETLKAHAAYKIIPQENLASGGNWVIETQKANLLENANVVRCHNFLDWRETMGCIVLKYDYVDGVSLRKYIQKHADQITIPFIRKFMETMLDLFHEMRGRNIEHGDFHAGNILVMKPSPLVRNSVEKFKVTDFGIGGVTSGASLLDDFDQLSAILSDLLGCLNYQSLSPEEKYAFNILNDHLLGKHLKEKDQTRDPLARNPDGLLKRLEDIDADYATAMQRNIHSSLHTPFDYLSCEQIGQDHSLLHALYSEKFLGISEIEAANNLVVTGPRGCGKSTVFKSLSLKQRILSENAPDLASLRYIGIYYHCSHDLYFKFPRYRTPEREDAVDLPIHYLTSRLLLEVLDTVVQAYRKEKSWPLQEGALASQLWETLSLKRPQLPNSDTFAAIIAALNKECQWALEKHQFASSGTQPIKPLYGPGKFLECCGMIQAHLPDLQRKPFYCFIDDYSMPHISHDLQRSLNRLLMQRNEYCFFKMATESPVSYAVSDIDDKFYSEGREFDVLNLGLTYLHGDNDRKLEFLDDVFNRRLSAVETYPVKTLAELIGESDGLNFNEMADQISAGEKPEWSGRKTLSRMCSGDVHQLITIVRRMVGDAGGPEGLSLSTNTPRIISKIQNKAIRAHAGSFLQSIADSGVHGEKLRKVVSAFGNIAYSYLRFKRSKNGAEITRHQASRIELHDVPHLEGEAKEIYEELLRYSVFIHDPRGKSIRGNAVPRLYLRRFLVPHFNLTFSLRDSVLMEVSEFETLLTKPEEFESIKRLKQDDHANDQSLQVQHSLNFGHEE